MNILVIIPFLSVKMWHNYYGYYFGSPVDTLNWVHWNQITMLIWSLQKFMHIIHSDTVSWHYATIRKLHNCTKDYFIIFSRNEIMCMWQQNSMMLLIMDVPSNVSSTTAMSDIRAAIPKLLNYAAKCNLKSLAKSCGKYLLGN